MLLYWRDRQGTKGDIRVVLNTGDWLMIIGAMISIFAGIFGVFRIVNSSDDDRNTMKRHKDVIFFMGIGIVVWCVGVLLGGTVLLPPLSSIIP